MSYKLTLYKKSYLLTGITKNDPNKEKVKQLGAKWNGSLGGWLFFPDKQKDGLKFAKEINAEININEETKTSPKKEKIDIKTSPKKEKITFMIIGYDATRIGDKIDYRPILITTIKGYNEQDAIKNMKKKKVEQFIDYYSIENLTTLFDNEEEKQKIINLEDEDDEFYDKLTKYINNNSNKFLQFMESTWDTMNSFVIINPNNTYLTKALFKSALFCEIDTKKKKSDVKDDS